MAHFGDIRAFFQSNPTFSQQSWGLLCDMLVDWEDERELHEVILPYVRSFVGRWPISDRHRSMPPSWQRYIFEHKKLPAGIHLVEKLGLRSAYMPVADLRRILNSADIAHIRFIDLSDNKYHDDVLHMLANTPNLRNLTRLYFDRNNATAAGIWSVLNSEHLINLKVLKVSDNRIQGALDLESFEPAQHHPRLNVLDIGECNARDPWFDAIIRHPALDTLTELNLQEAYLDNDALHTMLSCRTYESLRILILGMDFVTEQGATHLADATSLANLESIWFGCHQIGRTAHNMLYRAHHLRHLQKTMRHLLVDNYEADFVYDPYSYDEEEDWYEDLDVW